jgi:hypothetical protein
MLEILHKKVSPPFEGGVAGSTDYRTLTKLDFPDGVVDSLISSYLYCMKNENLFNQKKALSPSLFKQSTTPAGTSICII